VEQLGQIEEASFFRFARTRFAGTPAAVSTALGAVVGPDELPVEFGVEFSVELMSGVVSQIQSQENMNVSRQPEASTRVDRIS